MISSVEMVLWAIHHATTLLFGVFASAALCGIEINRRHALELVGVGAATGAAFSIANVVGGELFARQAYPLVVHLPLIVYLCALSSEPAARYVGSHQCLPELPIQQLDGHRRARRH